MRKLRFAVSILSFAWAAIPALATITYSYCSSGCSSTGGNYTAWQAAPGATGLAFSNPITFVSAGLSGTPAIYTDSTTGTVFNGYNNTTPSLLSVSGTELVQGVGGSGTSIQIVPPANTYALAFMVGANSFAEPWIELVNSPSNLNTTTNAQYQLVIPNSTSPQFFGIVSDAPIASIFIWNSGGGGTMNVQSFEVGEWSDTSPAPESATFFLIGGGLLGLYFLRRPISSRIQSLTTPSAVVRPPTHAAREAAIDADARGRSNRRAVASVRRKFSPAELGVAS